MLEIDAQLHCNQVKREYLKAAELLKKEYGCAICDENDPTCLDFHHWDPSTKKGLVPRLLKDRRTGQAALEIKKCVVICANCHRKHHAGTLGKRIPKKLVRQDFKRYLAKLRNMARIKTNEDPN